ncbi:MAG: DNA adenine methylase [Methylobacillus sp.]|jgi:DNA adenine methylase|nr:DNA adenine methylase [Methylobacillus sp.]
MRFHGGKFRIAPWIISHFPEHRIYVEPFGGAGSVLLRKQRSYAEVYNDLDGEVVNLFNVARDRGDELVRVVELTPFSRDEFFQSYTTSKDPLEQARRTLVRSFMGFGSASASGKKTGFRANSNRSHTTPAHDWMNYPDALREIIVRLRGVVIENKDALAVMRQHDSPETLHYADPPYVPETRDAGADYRHELTSDEHVDLLSALDDLSGMVILSGYRCQIYDDRLSHWRRVDRQAFADGASPRIESLWLNPACCVALDGMRLIA